MSETMGDVIEEKTGRGLDEVGKRKLKASAGIATLGIGGGTVTGMTAVQILVENGLLAPDWPGQHPQTYVGIMAVLSWLGSFGTVWWKKHFGRFPVSKGEAER